METNDVPAISPRAVGIRHGFILALISIIYFIVLTVLQIDMTQGPGRWLSAIFYVAIIILAQYQYKKDHAGIMSYSQGFSIGLWLALIAAPIGSCFSYLYMKFIDPTLIQQMKDQALLALEEKGLSQAQVTQAMSVTEKILTPEYILIMGIIGGFLILLFLTLIVTIFTQKTPKHSQAM